jgi:hypothetical protein
MSSVEVSLPQILLHISGICHEAADFVRRTFGDPPTLTLMDDSTVQQLLCGLSTPPRSPYLLITGGPSPDRLDCLDIDLNEDLGTSYGVCAIAAIHSSTSTSSSSSASASTSSPSSSPHTVFLRRDDSTKWSVFPFRACPWYLVSCVAFCVVLCGVCEVSMGACLFLYVLR